MDSTGLLGTLQSRTCTMGNSLPHSSENWGPGEECTEAAIENGGPSEIRACGVHETLDPSVERKKLDLQSDEEQHFYELFQKVRENIQDSKGFSDKDVSQAIIEINKSLNWNEKNPPTDYSRPDIICGYLFRYAPHSAGLARTRILEAVRNCSELKSVLEKEGELRVVSIGGGPGSDALGFCSVLSELGLDRWTSLNITIVDATENWRQCVTLLDQHLREGEFGSVSQLFKRKKVTMSFVQANLPGDPEKDIQCYDALTTADIIIECKMLFRLSFELRDRIIKALHETIKDDALMLPIHTHYYDQFWKNDFRFLYASRQEIYKLSNSNERFGHSDRTKSSSTIRVLQRIFRIVLGERFQIQECRWMRDLHQLWDFNEPLGYSDRTESRSDTRPAMEILTSTGGMISDSRTRLMDTRPIKRRIATSVSATPTARNRDPRCEKIAKWNQKRIRRSVWNREPDTRPEMKFSTVPGGMTSDSCTNFMDVRSIKHRIATSDSITPTTRNPDPRHSSCAKNISTVSGRTIPDSRSHLDKSRISTSLSATPAARNRDQSRTPLRDCGTNGQRVFWGASSSVSERN